MSLTTSETKSLRSEKQKKKKLSSTLEVLKQIKKAPSLSERLKRAGIKESKSHSDGKRDNLKKRAKKKKDYYKKLYLDKAISGTSKGDAKAKKQFQTLTRDYLLPYMKDSSPAENPSETPSENFTPAPKKPRGNVPANIKQTIFVSLDFIQDCQNYKRNVGKYKVSNLNRHQGKKQKKMEKKAGKKKSLIKKKGSRPVQETAPVTRQSLSEKENSLQKESEGKLTAAKKTINTDALLESWTEKGAPKDAVLKYFFEADFLYKPLKAPSSDNIGKIDKKFLESLLSITSGMEKGDKTKEEQGLKEANDDDGNEGKADSTEEQNDSVKSSKGDSKYEVQIESKPEVLYKELVTGKLNRDAAKSEIQIQPLKEKCPDSTKMKSEKNMSVSKANCDGARKKRKNRNKIAKSGNEEFVEASLPSEVSKVAEIKELWRREAREKSENSLSSYSSCTVPEGDEIPDWKSLGLQSYKILKKLVEEEVTKISQKSVKKDNKAEVENKENIPKKEGSQNAEKPKNNAVRAPLTENSENTKKLHDTKANETLHAQRPPLQVKKRQHYSVYEGRKQNSLLSNYLPENKDPKEKLQQLEEIGKNKEKIPSDIVKNWSILNRLEQAFLALGTPNFGEKKTAKTSQEKNLNSTKPAVAGSDTLRVNASKKLKKSRSKEIMGRKKNKNQPGANPEISPRKSTPKSQSDPSSQVQPAKSKRPKVEGNPNEKKTSEDLKENPQGNKPAKNSENSPAPANTVTDEEGRLKANEKKKPRSTPEGALRKKSGSTSPEKLKIHVHESRYPKKNGSAPERAKHPETKSNKFSKVSSKVVKLNPGKKSEGHLERKKVLSVPHKKDTTEIKSLKSKSFNKIEGNGESDGEKITFSQTKTPPENVKDKKEGGKIIQSGGGKRSSKTVTKSAPVKDRPLKAEEKPKSMGEKDNSTGSRTRGVQEKKCEKPQSAQEQVLPKKEPNSSSERRAIKERSILSLRAGQQDERKVVPAAQEKSVTSLPTPKACPETYENDVQTESATSHPILIGNNSDCNCVSTRTFDLEDTNEKIESPPTNIRLVIKEFQEEDNAEDSEDNFEDPEETLSVSSLSSHVFGKRQSAVLAAEPNQKNNLKRPQLWEKDINHYHAIVREIMSHYKRIDGFLKQSCERYANFSSSFVNMISEYTGGSAELNVRPGDLQEYRKKVMCEYQALPFSEYKKLQEKKDDGTKLDEGRKRNLQVVKNVEKGVDLDVKDFPLTFQKVLDSQLYVDSDLAARRNEALLKFKEKTSSLQETQLFKTKGSKAKISV